MPADRRDLSPCPDPPQGVPFANRSMATLTAFTMALEGFAPGGVEGRLSPGCRAPSEFARDGRAF